MRRNRVNTCGEQVQGYSPSEQGGFEVDDLSWLDTYPLFPRMGPGWATYLVSWGKMGFEVAALSTTMEEVRRYSDH